MLKVTRPPPASPPTSPPAPPDPPPAAAPAAPAPLVPDTGGDAAALESCPQLARRATKKSEGSNAPALPLALPLSLAPTAGPPPPTSQNGTPACPGAKCSAAGSNGAAAASLAAAAAAAAAAVGEREALARRMVGMSGWEGGHDAAGPTS